MVPEANTVGWPVVCRVFSLMLGPAGLFILAVLIARDGGGWLTGRDLAFHVLLAAVIAGRAMESRGKGLRTAADEPVTADDLRECVVPALLMCLAAWWLANLVGNHWPE